MTVQVQSYHVPVLLKESVDALDIKSNGVYADATYGGGGHSREILSRLGENGKLFAFDKDADAIDNFNAQGNAKSPSFCLIHNNFRFIKNFLCYNDQPLADGILADLGVSSHQFDIGERGFSFRYDAPLDMRMNRLAGKNAASVVNERSQEELEYIFGTYGEVDSPGRVAAAVIKAREKKRIETTADLAIAVKQFYNTQTEHKFLAKLFQALRIEVNDEMRSLEYFLQGALESLKSGGRLSIITYHSLEDRMVKNFLKCGNVQGEVKKDFYGRIECPFKLVTRKPVVPSEAEISSNTRSRSAKLRVAEKI